MLNFTEEELKELEEDIELDLRLQLLPYNWARVIRVLIDEIRELNEQQNSSKTDQLSQEH